MLPTLIVMSLLGSLLAVAQKSPLAAFVCSVS